jgi:hypothetical protein
MSATNGSIPAIMASVKRPWRTPRLPRVVGIKGACALLGVHKTTLNHWMEPGSGGLGPDKTYMIPPIRVGDGTDEDDGWPIWVREDVVEFAKVYGRQRAPAGQAKPRRQRSRDPEALREQIAALEKQLQAAEAKQT